MGYNDGVTVGQGNVSEVDRVAYVLRGLGDINPYYNQKIETSRSEREAENWEYKKFQAQNELARENGFRDRDQMNAKIEMYSKNQRLNKRLSDRMAEIAIVESGVLESTNGGNK